MEFNELKELIELFSKSDIGKLELDQDGFNLKLNKPRAKVIAAPVAETYPAAAVAAVPQAEVEAAEPDTGCTYVTSPIVGTFYRSPNPKADSFVEVGDRVTKGQTLCIVEAMKLMNEIQAEISGVVAEILVDNGEGVEFGQNLIAIKVA